MAENKTQIIIGAKDQTKKAFDSVKNGLSGIASSFASITTGFAAIGASAAAGFGVLASQSIEAAKEIKKTSDIIGASTDQIQMWKHAAGQTGVEFDVLDDALRELTIKIGDANMGTQSAIDKFEDFGISLKKTNGEAKSTEELFMEISKTINESGDKAKNAFLLDEIFGDPGLQLEEFLSKGPDQIKKIGDEFKKAGGIMDSSIVNQQRQIDENLKVIKTNATGVFNGLLSVGLPIVSEVTKALAGMGTNINFDSVKSALAGFLRILANVADYIGNLWSGIRERNQEDFDKIGTAMGSLANQIIEAWKSVKVPFETVFNFMADLTITVIKEIVVGWESLQQNIKDIIEIIGNYWKVFVGGLKTTWESITKFIPDSIKKVSDALKDTTAYKIYEKAMGLVDKAAQSFDETLTGNTVSESLKEVSDLAKESAQGALPEMGKAAKSLDEKIKAVDKTIGTDLGNSIRSMADAIDPAIAKVNELKEAQKDLNDNPIKPQESKFNFDIQGAVAADQERAAQGIGGSAMSGIMGMLGSVAGEMASGFMNLVSESKVLNEGIGLLKETLIELIDVALLPLKPVFESLKKAILSMKPIFEAAGNVIGGAADVMTTAIDGVTRVFGAGGQFERVTMEQTATQYSSTLANKDLEERLYNLGIRTENLGWAINDLNNLTMQEIWEKQSFGDQFGEAVRIGDLVRAMQAEFNLMKATGEGDAAGLFKSMNIQVSAFKDYVKNLQNSNQLTPDQMTFFTNQLTGFTSFLRSGWDFFNEIPRFHQGGKITGRDLARMPGMSSNEGLIIAQRGETVIPNGASMGPQNVQVVVYADLEGIAKVPVHQLRTEIREQSQRNNLNLKV